MIESVEAATVISTLAEASTKSPFNYSPITYLWVFFISIMGGVVNQIRKIKEGVSCKFNLTEFIGELVTSAFSGLLTFWLCELADSPELLSAVLIAISGHMGSRAIFMIEDWAKKKYVPTKNDD